MNTSGKKFLGILIGISALLLNYCLGFCKFLKRYDQIQFW
ncbi:hypothetical protein N42HA_00599 [Lactococcus lactis]|nr:hypothetical protein [Lactococcus lactis]